MKDRYYAHSHNEKPTEEWHRLEDHLKSVAELARTFADDFHAGDWGYLAGLWHDLEDLTWPMLKSFEGEGRAGTEG
jgi:hypothetical protein